MVTSSFLEDSDGSRKPQKNLLDSSQSCCVCDLPALIELIATIIGLSFFQIRKSKTTFYGETSQKGNHGGLKQDEIAICEGACGPVFRQIATANSASVCAPRLECVCSTNVLLAKFSGHFLVCPCRRRMPYQ